MQIKWLRSLEKQYPRPKALKKKDKDEWPTIYLPPKCSKRLRDRDVQLRDIIFTNATWKRTIADQFIKKNPRTKEQLELRKLWESFMGISKFPTIRSQVLCIDAKRSISTYYGEAVESYELARKVQEDEIVSSAHAYREVEVEQIEEVDETDSQAGS